MNLISLRAYGESRRERGLPGGSLAAVQKAIKSGRISLVDGKIDPDAADADWVRNTSVEQQGRGAGGGERPSALVGVSGGESYIDARARSEALRAQMMEIDLAEKRGELVSAEDIRRALADKLTATRDELLTIPERVAGKVASSKDPVECAAVIEQAIRLALRHLATQAPAATM